MSFQSYQLVMKTGPAPGKTFPIEKNEIYIGRDVANDVFINDAEISRRHARLIQQAGAYLLEDLGSTNGTYVNGQRIGGPSPLRPGDIVYLGENVSLSFEGMLYDWGAAAVSADSEAPLSPEPATLAPSPPPQPAYVPPAPPPQPVYSGRVPPQPVEPIYPEESRSRRVWLWGGCGCLVILACLAGAATLWYIDANYLWCSVMPFLPGC